MAIVYEHLRNDTNEVFYVGIGAEEKRAYKKSGRTPYWKNIVEKVGYTVDIIHSDVDWNEACELEKHLISLFGRKDLETGNLINLTDGGEGSLGTIISEKTRQKLSEARKGKNPSEETRQKLSKVNKGKTLSEETKQKISEATKGQKNHMFGKPGNNLGKTASEETRQKISAANKGRIFSEEHREKLSKARKGKTPRLGKKISPETIVKRNAKFEAYIKKLKANEI